jgi:hypothetical protein
MLDLKWNVIFISMHSVNAPRSWLLALALLAPACGDGSPDDDDDATEESDPGDGDGDGDGDGERCAPAEVACVDAQIGTLMLGDTASGGAIANEAVGEGVFLSQVDATAGGFGGSGSYTYARFTAEGLKAVELGDEQALESTDWDIAFRRYIIRLNSGVSGPSCVQGARTAASTEFATLDALPASLSFRAEQYFTGDTCELVPDTSGIGAPQTVLSSFWTYPGCVQMTGNVYVVRLASGQHVKLQVESYYSPDLQAMCDASGSVPMSNNGAGNYRVRWAALD